MFLLKESIEGQRSVIFISWQGDEKLRFLMTSLLIENGLNQCSRSHQSEVIILLRHLMLSLVSIDVR